MPEEAHRTVTSERVRLPATFFQDRHKVRLEDVLRNVAYGLAAGAPEGIAFDVFLGDCGQTSRVLRTAEHGTMNGE